MPDEPSGADPAFPAPPAESSETFVAPGSATSPFPPGFTAGARALVLSVPVGRVITYADVAEHVGWGSARHAAKALSTRALEAPGEGLPWWRVIRSDGRIAEPLYPEAAQHWRAEGTPVRSLRTGGAKVDMPRARWAPTPEALQRVDEAIEAAL